MRAPTIDEEVPSNALHVRCPTEDFEALGVRLPLHKIGKTRRETRHAWWEWLIDLARGLWERPFIISGDFNTDRSARTRRSCDPIERLLATGWQHAIPDEGPNFWNHRGPTKGRIDRTFLTHHWTLKTARYVPHTADFTLAGSAGSGALSDHAPLVIETDRL